MEGALMQYIRLTKNQQAIVDDDDYEWLSQWKWYYSNGYVRMHIYGDGKKEGVLMHRLINDTPPGMSTDHINGDKLDNRRRNLRTCTNQENMRNTGQWSHNTSGCKGVDFHDGKWRARIIIGKKEKHLGYYPRMIDAARARKKAEVQHFGEFRTTGMDYLVEY